MERTRTLVIGAGVSGLAFADRVDGEDYLICEASDAIGGFCKTVKQDGFTWDYSGHFFHFKHPELEAELISRMAGQKIRRVEKVSRIRFGDGFVDFPFQKNIHQLPKQDFIDCLVDLYFKDERPAANFQDMLVAKFGRSIAEKFLIPYNEKLYATDLGTLDVNAMGRFFPYADTEAIIRNFRDADNSSYNGTFTYPEGGAIQYVNALASGVDPARILLNERVESIDLERKVARTNKREIGFEYLISSAPLPKLLAMAGLDYAAETFSYNKVLVFNLGFDRKGPEGVHWIYEPDKDISFYRIGFYDNIFGTDRMSMYVELGYPSDAVVDDAVIAERKAQVLTDLERVGISNGHKLVSEHHIVLDPAYVHITEASLKATAHFKALLGTRGVYSVGRYGGWTYCAIEDNIVESRALADLLSTFAS